METKVKEISSCIISLNYRIGLDKVFSLREIYEAIVRHYLFVEIERSDFSYEYDEVDEKHRYIFSVYGKKGPLLISENIKMKLLNYFNLADYINFRLVSRSLLIYMIKLPDINLIYRSWGVLSDNIEMTTIKRLKGEIEDLERQYYVLPRTELSEKIASEKKAYHDVFMNKYLVVKKERLHKFMNVLSDETVQR